jgi:hypothetical protein
MKSIDHSWNLDEFIGLVVFGGTTAIYCYWIGFLLNKIIHILVNLI